jgi:hypothetical protein
MKLSKDVVTLLGLSKKEVAIIDYLDQTPRLASEIGRHVRVPRATLDRMLTKLHKRTLIGRHKYSHRRGGWVSAPFMDAFTNTTTKEAFTVKSFVGLSAMRQAEYDFTKEYKNIKCYGIQSTRAWRAWHSKLTKEEAAEINRLIGEKNILMDIVITKNVDRELLKRAYVGRPSLARTVPESFLPTAFDIETTNKEVFIMNWERLKGISIHDEEMALMFKQLIEFIKQSSEYYNIHAMLEKERKM